MGVSFHFIIFLCFGLVVPAGKSSGGGGGRGGAREMIWWDLVAEIYAVGSTKSTTPTVMLLARVVLPARIWSAV